MDRNDYGWRPYVSAAQRRRRAKKKISSLRKSGHTVAPVEIAGRKIATTFWGDAWCTNLETYSDYSNRMPRGRTYVRNGSVIDLQIEKGSVRALVSGSEFYSVDISIKPLAKKRWSQIKTLCAGKIDSLIELLRGSISRSVMAVVTNKADGLFPAPREIALSCSCPDWATMCKHVAAALYGVGARLDRQPEMLFTLRGVDPSQLVEAAVKQPPTARRSRSARKLATEDLSSVFGIEIDGSTRDVGNPPPAHGGRAALGKRTPSRSKTTRKKPAAKKAKKKAGTAKANAKSPAPKKKLKNKRSTGKKPTPGRATTKKVPARKAKPKNT